MTWTISTRTLLKYTIPLVQAQRVMREIDRQKFVRLANRRVSNAMKAIQLVGNLSNKSNYDYTEEDVAQIMKALQSELNACKKRFETASQGRTKQQFTLE